MAPVWGLWVLKEPPMGLIFHKLGRGGAGVKVQQHYANGCCYCCIFLNDRKHRHSFKSGLSTLLVTAGVSSISRMRNNPFPPTRAAALYTPAFLAFMTAATSFSVPPGKYTNMCLRCLSVLARGSTVGSRVSPWKSYGTNTHQSAELIENRSVWNKRKWSVAGKKRKET